MYGIVWYGVQCYSQCVTVPKMLDDTDTDTFFRYQIFSIPIPVLFSVANLPGTGNSRYQYVTLWFYILQDLSIKKAAFQIVHNKYHVLQFSSSSGGQRGRLGICENREICDLTMSNKLHKIAVFCWVARFALVAWVVLSCGSCVELRELHLVALMRIAM